MRSPFRYPGGKSKVQDVILKYMPSVVEEYREPFCGGGGIFFGLSPSLVKKRWINDKNPGLMEVYRAFRDRPEEFIERCRKIEPPREGEEEVSTRGSGKPYNKRLGEVFDRFKDDWGMDQALRYFFLNRTVWAGRVNYDPAFKSRLYYSNPGGWRIVEREGYLESVAAHVSGTEITSLEYQHVMCAGGDGVWIYLDPPYVVDTNLSPKSKLYQFGFEKNDHDKFVEHCLDSKHKLCISYDDHEDVRRRFSDSRFHIYEASWTYSGTQVRSGEKLNADGKEVKVKGKELIITNYPRDESRFGSNR